MKTEVTDIYKLNKVSDDPRFEGFALSEAPSQLGRKSIQDDLTPGFAIAGEDSKWKQRSLGSRWVPPKVVGRVSEFNDYPCIDLVFPAFSQRAVEVLRPFLESTGELLKLNSDTKTLFFFFNILTISDALNRSRSKCTFWCRPPTTATSIDHFEFHKTKLMGLSIFRIREMPSSVFVTNKFMNRVEFFGLRGFSFTKVWPLPVGVNWRMQKSQTDRKDRDRLKQHTLVLVLPFEHTAKQKKAISTFEDAADRRLKVTDLKQPYFGSYEGHDLVDNEYRMFFSAPDVDALYESVCDDIRLLKWPKPIAVYRRYGRMFDEKAREESTVL